MDWPLVAFPEVVAGTEVARHQEVHQRPEITHGVFDRRAAEREFVAGSQGKRGLGVLRVGILDVLRLVEDHGPEFDAPVAILVAAQERIAGDQQVGALRFPLEQLLPIRALDRQHPQLRGEALCLALPVEDERRRTDDQGFSADRP